MQSKEILKFLVYDARNGKLDKSIPNRSAHSKNEDISDSCNGSRRKPHFWDSIARTRRPRVPFSSSVHEIAKH